MISARSAQKAALKGIENTLGSFISEPQVEVQEGEGSLSMKVAFEVTEEGQISAGGETRRLKPGKYEINIEVTFGKRGNMVEARFFGKCGENVLSDMYVVEENKLDYVRNWLSDKVGALAVQCVSEAEEAADIGGVLGW